MKKAQKPKGKRKVPAKGKKPVGKAVGCLAPGQRVTLEKFVASVQPIDTTGAETLLTELVEAPVRTRGEIVADALMSMAEGVSLRKIAKAEGMGVSTLYTWLTVPEYAEHYARAREAQAMWWVEKALAVAAGTDDGQVPDVQRDRLHVDTLKWTASKFYPKQFGEKIDHTSGGESFGALVAASMKITTEAP